MSKNFETHEVGSGSGAFVRPIGNRQRRSSQPLDFLQNIALGVVTLFGQQEHDQRLRPNNRLGSVAEFQGMKALGIRYRHLCDLERSLARQTKERSLAQTHVIGKLVCTNEIAHPGMQAVHGRLRQAG